MLKFPPLALAFLTLLSTPASARSAVSNSSLQSVKPSTHLHAQVIMKGGGGQQQQSQPQQQSQTERREQPEQPRQGGLFGDRAPEQRSHQGGLFRDRGPGRRRPENFRRPYRPYEGRGQWHRERRHDR
jgi:hypothetical protein